MKIQDWSNVVSRLLIVYLFIWAGIGKIEGYSATAGYMHSMGVSSSLLPLVILLEVGGGLAVLFGFLTRFTSIFIAAFSIIAALIFHHDFSDATQQLMFTKDVSIAGGLLLLATMGPGKISIDYLISKNKK